MIGLSRIREHYADQYASLILGDGSEKFSKILEKIAHVMRGMKLEGATRIQTCLEESRHWEICRVSIFTSNDGGIEIGFLYGVRQMRK